MGTRIAAFAVIAVFLFTENALRRGQAARTIMTTPDDRGTTRLIGAAYAFALSAGFLAPLLSRWRPGHVRPIWLSRSGLPIMLFGLGLRIWAARTLGQFYTRTLRTAADQPVVQSGPYGVVRHPGYLGDLLMWLGFGLCSGTWIVVTSIAVAMGIAYARRVEAEEAMLRRSLGSAYVEYAMRRSRIVPGVY